MELLSILGISFSAQERPPALCMNETYTICNERLALRDAHLALFWVSNGRSGHATGYPVYLNLNLIHTGSM